MSVWNGVLFAAACLCMAIAPLEMIQAQQVHQHGGTTAPKAVELGTTAAVDRQGQLWVVNKETADGVPYLVLNSSADMGKTWSAPRRIVQEPVAARGDERPKIVLGPKGELYIVYTRPAAGSRNPHIGDIRFVRSLDGGKTFSEPMTVHANRDIIVHAFGSMIVDKAGNIYVAWVDGRGGEAAKMQKEQYSGNATYYAVSTDGGKTFKGDYKIADNSCECCRLSLSLTPQGHPVVMWRHIFVPNIRDHALAKLAFDGKPVKVERVTFDDWRVDACPHQGPSVAYAPDGTRHQVWFNGKEGDEGGVRYIAINPKRDAGEPISIGSALASHADVAVQDKRVAIVWKQFDGKSTAIRGRVSDDGGASWSERELAQTSGDSDKPYLVSTPSGIVLLWHTSNEGIRVIHLANKS